MPDNFNPWDFFGQQGNGNGNGNPNDFSGDWTNPDMSWVKDYVNDVMKQAFPGQFSGKQQGSRSSGSNISSDVFETHHFIIARIDVPEDILPENIRVMFHANELRLEGVESEPKVIRLPGNGLYKGSKALYKDHVLEIRIPKKSREPFQEIPIQM
ncbi:MAG TPA: Hsp20/alpha crystallin family protein [Bacillales bacterium]|nr:Hsp20/alpha crystallin family protein [Bacillales bacterium]